MDTLIGKKAYLKRGFYSGLIGTVATSQTEITKYALVFAEWGSTGFNRIEDIVLVGETDDDNKGT